MLKQKITFIACLLISLSAVSYSQSGWNVSFENSTYEFFSVYFVNNYIGYVLDVGGRVLKTTNSGVNWDEITNLQSDVIDIDFINEQTGFICGDTYCSILKTTNGGFNWQIKALYNQYMFDIDFIDSNTGFAVGEGGYIVKTTNSGNSWFQLYSPPNSSFYSISVVNPLTMFVAGNRIIKTTNGGINWIDISPWPINISSYFWSIDFVNKDSGCAIIYFGVYSTTNSGQTWHPMSDSINHHDVFFANNAIGYVCGDNGTILKTTTNGLYWHQKPTYISNHLTAIYFSDINTGYCVGRGGVILKTTNGGEPIGIMPICTEIPKHFSLSQNYPNPFNPVTKIIFSLPNPSKGGEMDVKLAIYDVLGKEIAILVNEQLKPGSYEVEFEGSNYPSGVYFYRFVAGDYAETKKMVLMK